MYTPTERILLALRWFGWVEPVDLLTHLDIEAADRPRYTTALSRLVKSGRIERDGTWFDG